MPRPGPRKRLTDPTRRNIILEQDLWDRAAKAADAAGISISAWIRAAIRAALDDRRP